jgi:hypothetical protein
MFRQTKALSAVAARLLRWRVPGPVAHGLIGFGIGILLGILFAREYSDRKPSSKDGNLQRRKNAHRYSRTSMPVGAVLGAALGGVLGLLVEMRLRRTKHAFPANDPNGLWRQKSVSSKQIKASGTEVSSLPGVLSGRSDRDASTRNPEGNG